MPDVSLFINNCASGLEVHLQLGVSIVLPVGLAFMFTSPPGNGTVRRAEFAQRFGTVDAPLRLLRENVEDLAHLPLKQLLYILLLQSQD
jgi:hypothetical protein